MPALSKATTQAIAKLGDELRFASRDTLVRHLDRIEELAAILNPQSVYPEDFIVFRVTGYRPDTDPGALDSTLLGGSDVLADLSALSEKLSEAAGLREDELPEGTLTRTQLSERWSVSTKTLERYRRLGLIARRVDRGSGRRVVVFTKRTVEAFEQGMQSKLDRASRFSRLSEQERARAIRWTTRYARSLNWNMSQCIERVSDRLGRSREAVRQTVAAHDEHASNAGQQPVFERRAPSDADSRRAMLSKSIRGVRPSTIAATHKTNASSVTRHINRARFEAIVQSGVLVLPESPVDEAPLEHPSATSGLKPKSVDDLASLIETMRQQEAAVVFEQTLRATCVRALLGRISEQVQRLNPAAPSGRVLDRIETDMRWIVMLRISLLYTQRSLVLQAIEQQLGAPIEALGPTRTGEVIERALEHAMNAVSTYDPSGGGKLAGRVGLAMGRFAARLPDQIEAPSAAKATRRFGSGHPARSWGAQAWDTWWWLRPDAMALHNMSEIDQTDQRILIARYGLDGSKPITLESLAQAHSTTPLGMSKRVRSALNRLYGMIEYRPMI